MTTFCRRGRPRPIFATRAASEAAARLGIACVENAVEEAILDGRKRRRGDLASVWLREADVVLARCRSPLGRPAWQVISVRQRARGSS